MRLDYKDVFPAVWITIKIKIKREPPTTVLKVVRHIYVGRHEGGHGGRHEGVEGSRHEGGQKTKLFPAPFSNSYLIFSKDLLYSLLN